MSHAIQDVLAIRVKVSELAAGFGSSMYMPLLFFFPFMAPVLRVLASLAPDRGLRRLKAARAVILQTGLSLLRAHRAFLAEEVQAPQCNRTVFLGQGRARAKKNL